MFKKIGILGVGNMGKIITKAIHTHFPEIELFLVARQIEKARPFAQEVGAHLYATEDLVEVAKAVDTMIICIKPHQFQPVFAKYYSDLTALPHYLWISIAVGNPLETLQQLTPTTHHWVRLMPNTPLEVGEGYLALCHDDRTSQEELEWIQQLFQPVAQVEIFDEKLFDTVSAIAGSGPAFMYQLVEAMADAGVKHGLNRYQAYRMIGQLLIGSGKMVLETDQHPGQLKDAVTSPGGTTIEGVAALEHHGFRSALISAIDQTIQKASILSHKQE